MEDGRGGAHPVLRGVSLAVPAGQTVALMGASGCGKTTLLRVCAGIRKPQSGRVAIAPWVRAPRPRGLVGYIPQQLGLLRNRSVLENTLLGSLARVSTIRSAFGLWPEREVKAAESVLQRVGLLDRASRPVAALSGGERQRVAIARTVLQRPAVLLADEFTANLDIVKAGQILDLVREATSRGVATVIALHNVALAREYADRVVFLRDGRIVHDAPAAEVTAELARRLVA
ncbi:MAG TPA: ATP-binding cassette domain-containing protein [Candidatus Thermoplasmatota archaeon]|nr:ATP-binding cassette domain-containing protein [Candidatus Thermoplasmatota archaeon]